MLGDFYLSRDTTSLDQTSGFVELAPKIAMFVDVWIDSKSLGPMKEYFGMGRFKNVTTICRPTELL